MRQLALLPLITNITDILLYLCSSVNILMLNYKVVYKVIILPRFWRDHLPHLVRDSHSS